MKAKSSEPNSAICTDEQQTSISNVESQQSSPPSPASISFQSTTLLDGGDNVCYHEVSQDDSVVCGDVKVKNNFVFVFAFASLFCFSFRLCHQRLPVH